MNTKYMHYIYETSPRRGSAPCSRRRLQSNIYYSSLSLSLSLPMYTYTHLCVYIYIYIYIYMYTYSRQRLLSRFVPSQSRPETCITLGRPAGGGAPRRSVASSCSRCIHAAAASMLRDVAFCQCSEWCDTIWHGMTPCRIGLTPERGGGAGRRRRPPAGRRRGGSRPPVVVLLLAYS